MTELPNVLSLKNPYSTQKQYAALFERLRFCFWSHHKREAVSMKICKNSREDL